MESKIAENRILNDHYLSIIIFHGKLSGSMRYKMQQLLYKKFLREIFQVANYFNLFPQNKKERCNIDKIILFLRIIK